MEDSFVGDSGSPGCYEGRLGLGAQTGRGPPRSERLLAGGHVPDRGIELAGEFDPGDLADPLLAEPARGVLVAGAYRGSAMPEA